MPHPTRPSKFGVPDVAPVIRRPDGKMTTRAPFTPSAHVTLREECRLVARAANRRR